MRVLITGGAGFIGSHLAEKLLARGHRSMFSTISRLARWTTSAISRRTRVLVHDRVGGRCASTVAELVDDADVVYHLAAAVGVELIVDSPVRTIETNVHCTEIVLAAANKKKKPVFIASTSEVYGKSTDSAVPGGRRPPARPDEHRPLVVRVLEGDRRVPRARLLEGARAAGRHRAAVQHRRASADRPLRHGRAVLRPSGAGRRADHGLRGRPAAAVLLPRRRTWCEAMADLMESEKAVGEVFNIGSTEEITILDLAERVRKACGSDSRDSPGSLRGGLRGGVRGHAPAHSGHSQDRASCSVGVPPATSDEILEDVIESQQSAGGARSRA